MANEKVSQFATSVSELSDTDLLLVSKDTGGGNFESQKMSGKILRSFFRAATEAITTSETQITFSSPLPNANYQLKIIDDDGTGYEKPTDLQASGFKIKGLSNGNIGYMAILNN